MKPPPGGTRLPESKNRSGFVSAAKEWTPTPSSVALPSPSPRLTTSPRRLHARALTRPRPRVDSLAFASPRQLTSLPSPSASNMHTSFRRHQQHHHCIHLCASPESLTFALASLASRLPPRLPSPPLASPSPCIGIAVDLVYRSHCLTTPTCGG